MRNRIIVCSLSLIKTYLSAFHVLRKFRDSAPLTFQPNFTATHTTFRSRRVLKLEALKSDNVIQTAV